MSDTDEGRRPTDGTQRARRGSPEGSEDPAELARLHEEARLLDEEVASLRRKVADGPKRVRALEERLLETKGQLAQAVAQNEKLSYTLREAREHIAALRDEVDKLTRPPSAYGVVVGKNEDGTVDVLSSGRKMRVNMHPDIEVDELDHGAEVALNESFNIILARAPERSGEVVSVREVMEDGVRAVVVGPGRRGAGVRDGRRHPRHPPPPRRHVAHGQPDRDAAREAAPARGRGPPAGGGARHRLQRHRRARHPDRGDRRRGRAALPPPGAVRRAPPAGAQGHPALRPARLRQDAHRQGRGQQPGQEGGGQDR